MTIVDDLSPGDPIPGHIDLKVTGIEWRPGRARRAEVVLCDLLGSSILLVDYIGADTGISWKLNHWYRISDCAVELGGAGHDMQLAPSKRTTIEPLGAASDPDEVLVIGDSHIGRDEHPGTGEPIVPLGAVITAVERGIDRSVEAVIHVGDIFHESATELDAVIAEERIFDPLQQAGIPFYYVEGNHSSPHGDTLLQDRPENHVQRLDLNGTPVGTDTKFYGLHHYPNGEIDWSSIQFPAEMNESASVLVLHQTLEQLSEADQDHVDLNRIQRRAGNRFDFVLCGHHHDAIRKRWQGTQLLYTGASESMSTNTDAVDRVAWFLTITEGAVSAERFDIPDDESSSVL